MSAPTGPILSAGSGRFDQDALLAAVARLRPLQAYAPAIVTLGLAVGIGLTSAKLVWALYDQFAPPPAPVEIAAPATTMVAPSAIAAELAASEPFGASAPSASADEDAPDTRLDLKLRGVIAAGEPRYSRAFIANGDAEEHAYGIGAALPGGATVQAVYPDRVVLARNGTLETLRLPRESSSIASEGAPLVAADLRGAQQNPSRLLDWLRPVVATESNTGRQLGYRVYPGRDPDRFTKLGLMPGDLITAVNGQPLDDPSRSMELMRNLTASDNITLTVERDGQQRLVQIPVMQ